MEGSQTQCGTSASTIKDKSWKFQNGTNGNNYSVTTEQGTLTVKHRSDDKKYAIALTGKSDTVPSYDGEEHTVSGVEQDKWTFDGVEYTVSNYRANASGTDAGTYSNIVTSDKDGYKVTDPNGNVVTEEFSISVAPGTLTIKPAEATVTAGSATRAYNGSALTAAEAGCALRRAGANTVEEVLVSASVNIIKNAMSAGIPGTSYEGMDYAAAIGAVGGEPVHLLEVMNYVAPEQVEQAAALVKAGKVKVEVAQVPQKLYVDVTVKGEGHTGRAVVRDLHTNVVLVQQDGETTLDKTNAAAQSPDGRDLVPPEEIAAFLTVKSIWDYCTEELDPLHDPIDIIRSAVKVNTAISEEGLSKEYGLAIGRNLELNCRKGLMTRDLTTNAMIIASAGADARMAGAPVSVVANSGSGNQGITATMPVVAAARWLDIDEEKMLRAVTLSNLIAIRIKSKFGRLSNLCGATVAGTGAACGITYLLGGGYHEICCAIQNMVGNVTGMVCDGAKADCALKISTCVNAACQAAAMGTRGVRVQSTDGIVEENVERTLDNFAILSTHGTSDSVILDLMLNKDHTPDAQ